MKASDSVDRAVGLENRAAVKALVRQFCKLARVGYACAVA